MSALRSLAVCCALLSASAALADPPAARAPKKATQYVIISFDGANDVAQWRRSRALAARTGARFTYFLSCVYLLSPETKKQYQPPRMGAGRSNVGFAPSKEDVAARLEQIRLAAAEEHEIASHGCGHFDGKGWTKADWLSEFASFAHILRAAYRLNGLPGEPAGWANFAASVRGFRAPYLSTGKTLYRALEEAGFDYDASGISRGPAEPDRAPATARFSLPQIPEGPASRRVIAMDYNLYVRHSGGFERPSDAATFETRTLDAFRAAFEQEYSGARTPLQLGFHFTLMNGGAYWRALERFAAETCVKAGVKCVSYRDYLNLTKPAAAAMGG